MPLMFSESSRSAEAEQLSRTDPPPAVYSLTVMLGAGSQHKIERSPIVEVAFWSSDDGIQAISWIDLDGDANEVVLLAEPAAILLIEEGSTNVEEFYANVARRQQSNLDTSRPNALYR